MKTRKHKPTAIPKTLKSQVLKKFRTKDKRTAVVVLAQPYGFSVATLRSWKLAHLREFKIPAALIVNTNAGMSHIPDSIWRSVQLDLAIWYARWVAHHKLMVPSARAERSKRRGFTKKALARHQSHMVVKTLMAGINGTVVPGKPRALPKLRTFIMIYDPRQTLDDIAYFKVHTATCGRLDHDRKKAVRRGGHSWVVEDFDVNTVVAKTLKELEDDGKGYDVKDFSVHVCGTD